MARILVVEDDPGVRSLLTSLLKAEEHEAVPASNGQEAMKALDGQSFDLMLTDLRMSPIDGLQLLKHVQEGRPQFPVILMTAHGTVETAVEAMKVGAYDYITKPFKLDELLMTVQRALEYHHMLSENIELKARLEQLNKTGEIVAASPLMRTVCEMITRVAPADVTVLIRGESGTGKELVAKSIHANSHRRARNFVAINCAALPEPLLESELFGHVKGAFTGATSNKEGLFQAADGGTLLLDEIGSMPLSLQGKLLRVLEEKEVRRVGDTVTRAINVRVLAATNERLEEQIRDGNFREDLYYRLNVITIDIPPLRDRPEDVLPLIDFLMQKEWKGDGPIPEIDPAAQRVLEGYGWPGNVRELENAIRHACTFAREGRITTEVLPARIVDAVRSGAAKGAPPNLPPVAGKSLKAYMRDCEQAFIRHTISSLEGDKRQAASQLKVSLATLYRKLPELDD